MPRAESSQEQSIFIVSSQEGLPVAKAVKAQFTDEAEVDIWTEDIFAAGRSFLRTLLDRASFYDFAIAVFSADDEARIRDRTVLVTRDNVIFEFGLFLGRLGPDRAFLLADRDVTLFSDWSGIKVPKYTLGSDLAQAVEPACRLMRSGMGTARRESHYSMLPSTALAMGYFHNFLRPVYDAFASGEKMTISARDSRGRLKKGSRQPILDRYPTIHIRLPPDLDSLNPVGLRQETERLTEVYVSSPFRSFPFYLEGDTTNLRDVNLFDIPTTLRSSQLAIQAIFEPVFLAERDNRRRLEGREIRNFRETIEKLQREHGLTESFAFSDWTPTRPTSHNV